MLDLNALHDHAKTMPVADWVNEWAKHADGTDAKVSLPPFPAEETQKITNNVSGGATMRGAGNLYRILDEEIGKRFTSPPRVLDYGAGWGRITRLMLRSAPPELISAVDVDKRLVDAGRDTLSPLDFRLIESGGRLPYPDDTFDVIFANSVFSHLSEDLHLSTLRELSRIMKPNGMFVGTTLAPRHYEKWLTGERQRAWIGKILGEPEGVRSSLADETFVFGATGRWPDYGIAIIPDGWTQALWPSAGFHLSHVRDDYSQIVNVAIKAHTQSRA